MQSAISRTTGNTKTRKTFVLVHVAWQAGFAWDLVKGDLVKRGNTIIVVYLLGHGIDNTSAVKLSIDACVDLQHKILAVSDVKKEFSLNSGHSPHLSQPHDIAKILLEIAAER